MVEREVKSFEHLYLKQEDIKIKVLTWNVGGVKAPDDFDMSKFF